MNKDEQVAVEQIDRDEAILCLKGMEILSERNEADLRKGELDYVGIVQAFARHRTRALEASQAGEGWVYFNPDSGEEYASNHPVESGECLDAENIRRSTLQEDALHAAYQREWQKVQELKTALTTPTRIEAAQPQEATMSEQDRAFEREERYIVIKRKHLTAIQETALRAHMARLGIGTSSHPIAEAVIGRNVQELVIAAREAWEVNCISGDALDKALEPFAAVVPYENEPDTREASQAEAGEVETHGDWLIWYQPWPITNRENDWHYAHKDARGDDLRVGNAESREQCLQIIDWMEQEDEKAQTEEGRAQTKDFVDAGMRSLNRALLAHSLKGVLSVPGLLPLFRPKPCKMPGWPSLNMRSRLMADFPEAFDGCTCLCHRQEGVYHFVACCGNYSPLTTPTRIEASQLREAVQGPDNGVNCSSCGVRLPPDYTDACPDCGANDALFTPPIQAADGLLERAAIVAFLREQDKLEGVTYSDYAWAADAIERGDHLPAKAGKPGEAGNG